MQTIQKPSQELHWITLIGDLEPFFTALHNRLQHFVRRYMRFEVSRIP